MDNTLRNSTILPPPEVAVYRLKDYTERKWKEKIEALSPIHRMMVAEYLVGKIGLSREQAGIIMGTSKATVHRDIQSYQLLIKRVKTRVEEMDKIHDYILYNAKWAR